MAREAVDTIRTGGEIAHCVDMYLALNDDAFLPASRERSIKEMTRVVKLHKYFRVLRSGDGVIHAWIYGDIISPLHTDALIFQQMYYASDATGVAAIRYLQTLHQDMANFAKKNTNCEYALSISSHMDTTFVLSRALERIGWARRGGTALLRLRAGSGP